MDAYSSSLLKKMIQEPALRTPASKGETAPKEETDMLVFFASNENFAIPVAEVEEILPAAKIHVIPAVPPYILGVINRGLEVIPVVNLEKLLKIPPSRVEKRRSRLMILKVEEMVFALEVPKVIDVVAISKATLQALPSDIASQPQGRFFAGYVKVDNRLILLLDLHKLVQYSMEEM